MQIASLLDLAGTKPSVVQQRDEASDYTDIDAILHTGRIDLPTALAAARAIYRTQFNPQISLKALSYFDYGNLPRLPKATGTARQSGARGRPRPLADDCPPRAVRHQQWTVPMTPDPTHFRDGSGRPPGYLVRGTRRGSFGPSPLPGLRHGTCDA